MPTTSSAAVRVVRYAMVVALLALIAAVPLDGTAGDVAIGVVAGACALGAIAGVVLARQRPRVLPLIAATSCVGLAVPLVYLHSLPADDATIPLGEVGVMMLSLVAMVVVLVLLRPRAVVPA